MIKHYPNLGLIVALGQNNEIGYQNQLIWRIKEDLNFFKNVTMNSYIIMGRVTYESMPKNLLGRKYIVLSKDPNYQTDNKIIIHHDINNLLALINQEKDSMFYVIGGGAIYSIFLPYVSLMHLTKINASYPSADAYFPIINDDDWIKESGNTLYCEDHQVSYQHTLYLRQ